MASRLIPVPVAAADSGDNELVAAQAGKRIRVLAYNLSAAGTVNAKFKSGASTDLTGLFYGTAGKEWESPHLNYSTGQQAPLFQTADGEALNLNLSDAVAVGGWIIYEVFG